MKNQEKGITLIALVITIIVLLILAGVTIATLTGDNGILTKAAEAKQKTELARQNEIADLVEIEELMNTGTTTTGYNKEKQVNTPKISSNQGQELIPIKWNGDKWIVCEENDEEWYNYEAESITTKEGKTVPAMSWANAMLSDGKYKKGEVQVGQEVLDDELGSMFVWIPRYAYSINEYKIEKVGTDGTTQNITKIEFLKGNTNIGTSGNVYEKDYNENNVEKGKATPMISHPAFNFGGVELQGIWIAKFQASMKETNENTEENNNVSNKTVKVLPNAETWRYINEGNIFKTCLNMKEKNTCILCRRRL